MDYLFDVKALVKECGYTVAVDLLDLQLGAVERVKREDFPMLQGLLRNAIVAGDTIRARSGKLPVVILKVDAGKVRTYTIMYEDTEVLSVNRETSKVRVQNVGLLPFGLRNKQRITALDALSWIERRVSNLNRTYMNMVYVARGVGRETQAILRDSCGVSVTDNYWIKTSDVKATWSELCSIRDISLGLSGVALTGQLSGPGLTDGVSSLFSLKGYYPKAVHAGHMYKRQEDSLAEYLASYIGQELGVSVQTCRLVSDLVEIDLFTDSKHSLVHARELMEYRGQGVSWITYFTLRKRPDLVSQLQRLYIFNYIVGNIDLHDENYGFLYDPGTFEILSVAPCFDHNLAFVTGVADPNVFHSRVATSFGELHKLAKAYISLHPDIVKRLMVLDLGPILQYLSDSQLSELKARIEDLLDC